MKNATQTATYEEIVKLVKSGQQVEIFLSFADNTTEWFKATNGKFDTWNGVDVAILWSTREYINCANRPTATGTYRTI